MDKTIKKVIETIEKDGYEAFIVGGYVRDQLLGRISYDIDIATNALPKEIRALFNIKSVSNYGSSNIKLGKFNVDITTFREDIKYENRKPAQLKYVRDLKTDVKRRDFTINSICMDKNGKIIDYLNGVEDLNKHLIRTIGNVEEKIKEDPLRILRAIRFATILDFDIDKELYEVIKKNCGLVLTLSKERIKQEYSKILHSPNYKKGLNLSEELGINKLLEIVYEEVIYTNDLLGMWAQVKIKDIPFTKEEKSNIIKIKEIVKLGYINNFTLYKFDLYVNTVAGSLLNYSPLTVNKIYKKLPIKDRSEIAMNSDEILDILEIKPGKALKDIYKELETKILIGELKNKKEELRKYLIMHKGKW